MLNEDKAYYIENVNLAQGNASPLVLKPYHAYHFALGLGIAESVDDDAVGGAALGAQMAYVVADAVVFAEGFLNEFGGALAAEKAGENLTGLALTAAPGEGGRTHFHRRGQMFGNESGVAFAHSARHLADLTLQGERQHRKL